MTEAPRLAAAYAVIDAANALDPRSVRVTSDSEDSGRPYELVYGRRMSATLTRFAAERALPTPSEALRLAVRAQHLERWTLPRDSYPMDRPGYHRWRTELKAYHARRAAEILQGVGYAPGVTDRVGYLLEKRGLGRDPETQTLECRLPLSRHRGIVESLVFGFVFVRGPVPEALVGPDQVVGL